MHKGWIPLFIAKVTDWYIGVWTDILYTILTLMNAKMLIFFLNSNGAKFDSYLNIFEVKKNV